MPTVEVFDQRGLDEAIATIGPDERILYRGRARLTARAGRIELQDGTLEAIGDVHVTARGRSIVSIRGDTTAELLDDCQGAAFGSPQASLHVVLRGRSRLMAKGAMAVDAFDQAVVDGDDAVLVSVHGPDVRITGRARRDPPKSSLRFEGHLDVLRALGLNAETLDRFRRRAAETGISPRELAREILEHATREAVK